MMMMSEGRRDSEHCDELNSAKSVRADSSGCLPPLFTATPITPRCHMGIMPCLTPYFYIGLIQNRFSAHATNFRMRSHS
jgi:hypothetical protein